MFSQRSVDWLSGGPPQWQVWHAHPHTRTSIIVGVPLGRSTTEPITGPLGNYGLSMAPGCAEDPTLA
eukprot:5938443-Prymnesium_polylepis.1